MNEQGTLLYCDMIVSPEFLEDRGAKETAILINPNKECQVKGYLLFERDETRIKKRVTIRLSYVPECFIFLTDYSITMLEQNINAHLKMNKHATLKEIKTGFLSTNDFSAKLTFTF